MSTAQIIVIGFKNDIALIEEATETFDANLQSANDIESALTLTQEAGADIVIFHHDMVGNDPIDLVAQSYASFKNQQLSFVFYDPEGWQDLLMITHKANGDGYAIDQLEDSELKDVLEKILSPEDNHINSLNSKSMEEQLLEIGFNHTVRAPEGDFVVQTEVQTHDAETTVRTTVFDKGQIVVSRSFPVDKTQENPVESTQKTSKIIHDKALESIMRNVGGKILKNDI